MDAMKTAALKPQDILVACKIFSLAENPRDGGGYTVTSLSSDLDLSTGETCNALDRCRKAQLLISTKEGEVVSRRHLHDLLTVALPRIFFASRGGIETGMATAMHAKPLFGRFIVGESAIPYVWTFHRGGVKGQSISPIYPSVPVAAERDPYLYELLSLADVIRVGDWKSRAAATSILDKSILK
jgi:hypothetical protein